MPIVPVCIPQIGEGLQEARLVAVLKQPGDLVRRDEPIYQMETDKAVMDVESPFTGTITKWLAEPDTLLPIGAEILMMEIEEESPAASTPVESIHSSGESIASLFIPQIGEGLQEARLVAVLKNPGDKIKRDEPIYQMETDKAVMDVESPLDGELVEWTVAVDTVLPIGAEVGKVKIMGAAPAAPVHGHAPSAPTAPTQASTASTAAGPRRTDIPPRTRAYAKEKAISEEILNTITGSGSKLMPADIDAFLAGGSATTAPKAAAPVPKSNFKSSDREMAQKQRLLSSRMVRGSQLVVPGTITVATIWEGVEALSAEYKATGEEFQPSRFTMFAYAMTQALKEFPGFRSSMIGDSTIRTYDHVHLGIAVALPGDELVLAVIDEADTLTWKEFAEKTREQINLARAGKDQAHEAVTVSLTNMQAYGLRDAVPVVVPPSLATVFLGEAYNGLDQTTSDLVLRRYVNIAMTFDHRLMNGVGASDFINKAKANVEGVRSLINT